MTKFEGAIANKEVTFVRLDAPYGAENKVQHPHLYNFEQSGRFLFATVQPSDDGFDEVRVVSQTTCRMPHAATRIYFCLLFVIYGVTFFFSCLEIALCQRGRRFNVQHDAFPGHGQ